MTPKMQIMEHVHQVTFDDFPKMLVELNREGIRAWCFVGSMLKIAFRISFSVNGAVRNSF